MPIVLALCGLGALLCAVGVFLHLRTLRRLDSLAREVDRRVMPYLTQHAVSLRVEIAPTEGFRTPESVIQDACQLAETLLDLERKAEDMALGPTQNLTPSEIGRKG